VSRWTTHDIPDLSGRTAVVTGANSGIGTVTARELAAHGARVVLACRSRTRGQDTLDALRVRLGADARLDLVELDLADLASVRRAADEIRALLDERVDLLVNNAGVMALPLRRTADEFEMQFGTNHLGHFALTGLLMPALLAVPEPRVVTVTSNFHRYGRIDFANLNAERRYQKWQAYGQSKLANLLFTLELDRRARAAGSPLRSLAAHPGSSNTNLALAGPRMARNRWMTRATERVLPFISQSADDGALPSLRAATDPAALGNDFFGPSELLQMKGAPVHVGRTKRAQDVETARELWTVSESLTGVTYPI
jgi:NAD(P)-dependent dehydrogenase (short-subunit alcohol dehydrogenase family)